MALLACGCTTTQTTAARLRLNDSRLRAEAVAVRVTAGQISRAVTVTSTTVLPRHAGGTSQVAVTVENHGTQPISDLPISVGYWRGSRVVYLNGAEGLAYFEDHLPSIRAHGSLTWVYAAARPLPRGVRTFVHVGAKPSVAVGRVSAPSISVASSVVPGRRSSRSSHGQVARTGVRISVTNASSITQYQLPVYAILSHDGHIVAAGDRSIATLAPGAEAVVEVPFYAAGTGSIRVQAPATIFH